MNIVDPAICQWDPAPYLFFSGNIWGNFIYYSHLFPLLSGLIIALVVFLAAPKSKPAQALLFTILSFSVWSLSDLILWASDRSDIIIFVWSTLIYFELFVYIGAFYFIYSFFRNKFPHAWYELFFFVLFIPLFLFGHTELNLLGFDFTNCWREALEGPLWQLYIYYVEFIILFLIIVTSVREVLGRQRAKNEIMLVSLGTIFFLLSFSLGNLFGSIETDWELGQIGLFGMPIFVFLLAYCIIRFRTFQLKVLATEALMSGMMLLLVSLFFVRTVEDSRIIAAVTLFLFTILGVLLVRSVKKEVEQRQQIQKLAERLEHANARLKELDRQKSEFVSIASHQLRSPLTAIRGYVSMMRENSFGVVPEKLIEPLRRVEESTKFMTSLIDDFLNVSRIEAGNMKYDYGNFALPEVVEQVTTDLQTDAHNHGLLLMYRADTTGDGMVRADKGKLQQILHNVINNAIKYTKKGSVSVYLHRNATTFIIDVIDTGIGISPETKVKLFEKFTRAKLASSNNISGTGLGLFVAREMARAMGGDITVDSEGEGKGSKFTITIPVMKAEAVPAATATPIATR